RGQATEQSRTDIGHVASQEQFCARPTAPQGLMQATQGSVSGQRIASDDPHPPASGPRRAPDNGEQRAPSESELGFLPPHARTAATRQNAYRHRRARTLFHRSSKSNGHGGDLTAGITLTRDIPPRTSDFLRLPTTPGAGGGS